MNKLLGAILSLCMLALPCQAQTALHGHASVVTLHTPTNYACFPVNENGPATPIPSTCTGSATVLQSATTFTSLTAIMSRPVEGANKVSLTVEDFTTGSNVSGVCQMLQGQASCIATFSFSVSAGDVLAIKIWNDLTGTADYNVENIHWVYQ